MSLSSYCCCPRSVIVVVIVAAAVVVVVVGGGRRDNDNRDNVQLLKRSNMLFHFSPRNFNKFIPPLRLIYFHVKNQ